MRYLDFTTIKKLTNQGNYKVNVPLRSVKDNIDRFIKEDNLNFDVDFQRAHVWTERQQSLFIEFLLKGGKTQPILFNHPGWMASFNGEMVIVDGKQRVTAIIAFFENKLRVFGGYLLSEIKELRLTSNLEIEFAINNLQTRKEVLKWYIELNSGGTVHTEEEIKKVKDLLKKEDKLKLKL